ncbi:acyl-CoA/acyl-ACP dehydrogenase [Nocardia zapadnayensis]|uniref:acyl-CoA dehydrogenase family protein n=1 Tax=Nocardia rhamnosiphila TaxID=426716 RepID=UPI002246EB46|nr:acyl-CoA dehydrogenase family protein [Nocardia zapadnayensis]MCX0272781.1 acyl-CoA/acyl-ACP dehydrogenase [Nocardia zapadnayensis]
MEFALNDEQTTLQDVVREFLTERAAEAAVRERMAEPAGFDRQLWKQMGTEIGLQGIAVPEEYGGAGFTFVELGIVLEELGRALTVSPFLASGVMAPQLLLALGDEAACTRWLPGIANGDLVATVALAEDSGSWQSGEVTLAARSSGDGWRLDGHKSYVVDGAGADLILVVARAGDELGVFAVDAAAPGLERTPLPTMDQTRKLARLTFADTPAERLVSADAEGAVARMLDLTSIALAADSLGGTGRVLDMAVEYAKVREQFGRPIGSFQAIKHMCASMLVELESSRSAVYYALWAAATGHADVPVVAPMVKAHCVDAYLQAAGDNIQIHGGIGFTWEHPAHLYLKRAKSSQALLGGSDFHRQLLADRLGI